jgi:hypothetical protein
VLRAVAGEPKIVYGREPYTDRWEYCWDTEKQVHVYLHLNCDVVAENGYCLACGTPDPIERGNELVRRAVASRG